MEWIETLNEPITKIDVLYAIIGYVGYTWGKIIFEICKKIYNVTRKS